MTNTPLSGAAIKDIVDGMPDGLNGFTKHWGWLQFARKIEAAHGITQQTTMPTPTIKAGQRLLIKKANTTLPTLSEVHIIEVAGDYVKLRYDTQSDPVWIESDKIQPWVVRVLFDPPEPKPYDSTREAIRLAGTPEEVAAILRGKPSMADTVREASKIEYGPRHSTYTDGFPYTHMTYTKSSHENLSPIVFGSLLQIAKLTNFSFSINLDKIAKHEAHKKYMRRLVIGADKPTTK